MKKKVELQENARGLHDLEEIKDIFKSNLKIESNTRPIDSLFSMQSRSRIKYDPYYQRKYVWDKDKASYLIESILLGTEIPPLVFFKDEDYIEVIDGRQRYETILKYTNNEFALNKKGLPVLKSFQKKYFKDLPKNIEFNFYEAFKINRP